MILNRLQGDNNTSNIKTQKCTAKNNSRAADIKGPCNAWTMCFKNVNLINIYSEKY